MVILPCGAGACASAALRHHLREIDEAADIVGQVAKTLAVKAA